MKKNVLLHFESKLINGFHLSNLQNDIDKPIIFYMKAIKYLMMMIAVLLAFASYAEEIPTIITISSDGTETTYELADAQKIVFARKVDITTMTMQRTNHQTPVTDIRKILFGSKEDVKVEDQTLATKVYVFPNPVKEFLTISGINQTDEVKIYDINGKLVKSTTGSQINVDHLASGNYLLQVKGITIKFVKQ